MSDTANQTRDDQIHAAITAEVERRELSAYRLAQMCGGKPNKESISRYLRGTSSLTSPYLSRLLSSLGLEIRGTGRS